MYGKLSFRTPSLWERLLWNPSYFVSSVGRASLEVLKKYIQNQEKPF